MKTQLLNKCIQCAEPTTNPKFCGRSCSSSYNNSISPKRTAVKVPCRRCSQFTTGRNLCESCSSERRLDLRTVGEIRKAEGNRQPSVLRARARKEYFSNQPTKCMLCKYDKHVEVAHIYDLSEFADEIIARETWRLSNLLGLCPNCHWEFDHDML